MRRLQAMELFASAVREGSFSAAGRRAGLSPAAVSRQVAALEASLGTQLLNRTSRSLALTEAGREYLARLEPILQDIAEAEAAAAALQATPRGTLRVHSRLMFGMRVVAPLIPAFQERYPELRVELRLAEHAARLAEDDIDVDLRIGAPPERHLMQRRLLRSERVLVASPDYLTRMPALRSPRDLLAHHCLAYWMGPEDVVWRFLDQGVLEELRIAARFSANNGEVLRQMALAGHGIALLDDYTVREELEAGRLTRLLPHLRVTNTGFELGIFAVFRQTSLLPAKTRAFLDFLVAALPRSLGRAEAD
ncbi:LysR family transcriptional regulator [Roseomonas stagni]|uniref:LysR family transcriptional regulator n=1 Tax=Falsiroseomonas algicola TaxID=2716930 RepID=A0A6M1LHV5_9PROT|nr:LysR family transcriptional regulator [Falsiroseomonas algicola]NGM19732.1 LysR family transcriptional regulator [Falsiroseomonas algicola]